MTKSHILYKRQEHFSQLFDWLEAQPCDRWELGPEGKWTTGQHILHLIQSEKALHHGLKLPALIARFKWGKPNRIPHDYDEVATRYREKLIATGPVTSPFSQNMESISLTDKLNIISKLHLYMDKVNKQISRLSDSRLQTQLLPHPLMGRMVLSELLYWSAHHIEHHLQILSDSY